MDLDNQMLGFTSMMLGSKKVPATVTDPYAANRTFTFYGNGDPGAKPTVPDVGSASWRYRDTNASLSSGFKYFSDYDTSLFFNGNGIICDPSAGDNNLVWQQFGPRFNSWSHMMRVSLPTNSGQIVQLKMIGINATTWATNDLIYSITVIGSGSTWQPRLDILTNTGAIGNSAIVSGTTYSTSTPLEILVTRNGNIDGTQGTTYFFVNGTLQGTFTGIYPGAASVTALKAANAGSANTGTNLFSGNDCKYYLNDEYVWNTCIATASYTPQTKPFA